VHAEISAEQAIAYAAERLQKQLDRVDLINSSLQALMRDKDMFLRTDRRRSFKFFMRSLVQLMRLIPSSVVS